MSFKEKIFKDKVYIFAMYIYNSLFAKSLFKKNIYKWIINEWDSSLLINYPLDSNSIVVDVGWYIGVFSDKILSKYDCNLYIFEPVKQYYELLQEKYKSKPKVHIFPFWLWDKYANLSINLNWERSSVYTDKQISEDIIIRPFHEVVAEENIDKIDLISMNIEWGEYELIDNIVDHNIINNIGFLQIQFHDFIENAVEKRENAIQKIEKTHKVHYSYPFVRESFSKI